SGCVTAYTTAFAISFGSSFLRSLFHELWSVKFVSTIPGEIFVTRTPVLASSFSRPAEMARTANFVALLTVLTFGTSKPDTDAMLIIWPHERSNIDGNTLWML